MENQPAGERRLVRCKEFGRISGLSRTQRWRMERAGVLPARVQISAGAVGWWLHEILAALDRLPRGRADACAARDAARDAGRDAARRRSGEAA